jgi:hypothetical protein
VCQPASRSFKAIGGHDRCVVELDDFAKIPAETVQAAADIGKQAVQSIFGRGPELKVNAEFDGRAGHAQQEWDEAKANGRYTGRGEYLPFTVKRERANGESNGEEKRDEQTDPEIFRKQVEGGFREKGERISYMLEQFHEPR